MRKTRSEELCCTVNCQSAMKSTSVAALWIFTQCQSAMRSTRSDEFCCAVNCQSAIFFNYFFTLCCPNGKFFPLEIWVTFPKESQLQQSRYPVLINGQVHAGSFHVVIHQTMTWTRGALMCVRNHSYACVYTGGLGTPMSQHNILTRKNSHKFFLCFWWGSNLGLWISSPTLYQLSHPVTPRRSTRGVLLFVWSEKTLYGRTRQSYANQSFCTQKSKIFCATNLTGLGWQYALTCTYLMIKLGLSARIDHGNCA